MLILRNGLDRPLSWEEMDHNFEVLEINAWVKQGYEKNQKCFVVDGSYTTIYNCVYTHTKETYEPADVFSTTYGSTTIWEPISSTYNGLPSNTDIYVTGMTYNSSITGNTLTVHQTLGYPDVAVFIPSYALYDHYVSNFTLTGTTLSIYRTGGQSTLTVDLQPIIDIATGVTSTNTYVTGGTLNTSNYHLYLRRNDGVIVDINLYALHDTDIYTTGATLNGSIATFNKNAGSPYTLDLSSLVVTGATSGYSGFSGYSGKDGAALGSGYSGFSGYSGESNISGYSGYSGASTSGLSGFSGYSGIGTSGYSGYSGAGTSGYSGYSGTGISGYSGYSGGGTSGYSGYSGAQGLYGASSLILNGGGACTTDFLNSSGTVYDWSHSSSTFEVLTGSTSGFNGNALKASYYTNGGLPAGCTETSFRTVSGVQYYLTFNYKSNVPLDVLSNYTSLGSHQVYSTYGSITSSVSGVTLSFTAVDDGYLCFGAGVDRSELIGNGTEWWIIDDVNLRCGNCTGGTSGTNITINNNGNTRILTANGTTTSIDAQTGLTYNNGYLLEKSDAATVLRMESFHTGTTMSGPVLAAGATLQSVRGRGNGEAPKGLLANDVLHKHSVYGYYGTGATHHEPVELMSLTVKTISNMNVENPTLKSEYLIQMHNQNIAVESMDDKFKIDENGDVIVYNGLYVTEDLNLSTPIVYKTTQTLGESFSYLGNVTGSTDINFYLPNAKAVSGRVYYVCQIQKLSTGKLNLIADSGDTFHWQASGTIPFAAEGDFVMIQSDGDTNWIILSSRGV